MNIRFLLSTQRSGSHFLKSLINANFNDIVCTSEMLEPPVPGVPQAPVVPEHPDFPHFWPWYENRVATGEINRDAKKINAFATYMQQVDTLAEGRQVLADTKYNSLIGLTGQRNRDLLSFDFVSFVASRRIPVLHLIRKNVLRTIVSYTLAAKTNVWHRFSERAPEELLPKFRLNPKFLLIEIKHALSVVEAHRKALQNLPGYAEIVYEDLVQEHESSGSDRNFQTLAHFFGKPPLADTRTEVRFKKTGTDDCSEVVQNWDELVRLFRTTPYAWMTETHAVASV